MDQTSPDCVFTRNRVRRLTTRVARHAAGGRTARDTYPASFFLTIILDVFDKGLGFASKQTSVLPLGSGLVAILLLLIVLLRQLDA